MKLIPTVAAVSAALAVGAAPMAAADPGTADFGTTEQVTDGQVVTAYTIDELRPSTDRVDVPLAGHLYESQATVKAVQGTATPAVPFFNARTADGQTYRVLFQAPAPAGLPGTPLAQGQEATGKLYFDVTGPAPTQVVYNDSKSDRLIWQDA